MNTPRLTALTVVVRSATVLDAQVDDELVATSLASGLYYSMNAVAARIWKLTTQPVTIADVCLDLVAHYDVDVLTCESEVLAILTEMCAEGLIDIASPDAAS